MRGVVLACLLLAGFLPAQVKLLCKGGIAYYVTGSFAPGGSVILIPVLLGAAKSSLFPLSTRPKVSYRWCGKAFCVFPQAVVVSKQAILELRIPLDPALRGLEILTQYIGIRDCDGACKDIVVSDAMSFRLK